MSQPFPQSFIRDLKLAFDGAAQEDAVLAAKTGNYYWLGLFLECPEDRLRPSVVRKCLYMGGEKGMLQLNKEFERMQLRRQLTTRHRRICERRAKSALSS